ncbi:tubulin polyglutamylase complex subunit 2-like isoform X2 [Gracilinanus agilis]|uniref:tubulin polyglutamylase complex subunit 2-like isoform X2 n=1 Tax=Gracilinanus agilis TaxID=191870 RepID=UPI001CFE2BA0|nr:tubulin polyglutamylase complex subunit 2-like isoform X2 [Gracilinanus agilis]
MEEKVPPTLANTKPHLEKLTLGITRILEASPGVTKVQIIEKEPAERHMIASWELKNDCAMPEDLKNFYLMTNGFHMVWSVKLDDQPVPLGSLVINSIANLTQLTQSAMYTLPNSPTLEDLEDEEDEANEDQPEKPHFDSRSIIFELDSCNGNGKVCLVYRRTSPDNFTSYYRLLITHMGLPQWQYAFTSYGVSPQAKQWFNMYKPVTYNTPVLTEENDCFINKLDPSKVFKNKTKTLVPTKRGGTPHPPGSQKGSSSSSTKSSSGNPVRK